MRIFLLVGLVMLAALVCLPAAVSAAGSDSVIVTGSIGGSIDVDVTPDAGVTMTLVSGTTVEDATSANLQVITNYNGWNVAATTTGTPIGHMVAAGDPTKYLTNPFYLGSDFAATMTYVDMSPGAFPGFAAMTSEGGGTYNCNVGLRQQAVMEDEARTDYQITITFTGGGA